MKKIVGYILIIVLVMVSGCNLEHTQDNMDKNQKVNNTVNVEEDMYYIDILSLYSEKVIINQSYINDYAIGFSNMGEMAEYSDLVVYGEVKDIAYKLGANGSLKTYIEIEVLEDLKGNLESGSSIKIVKDQGIATLKDYLDSFSMEEVKESLMKEYEKYSEEEMSQLYVVTREQGDIETVVGQKSVYFLSKSSSYEKENTYTTVIGPQSEYVEISEDQFVRVTTVCELMNETLSINEESVEYIQKEAGNIYGLEKIKENI